MKHLTNYKIFENNSPNFPTTKAEVIKACNRYGIGNYTINDDLSIDVDGDVGLNFKRLEYLPLRFNYVSGGFSCRRNILVSLEGCPQTVGRNFFCYDNELKTLEGCPQTVGGDFDCYNNKLKDLEHFPEVGGDIYVDGNMVYNLVYTFIKKADSFMIEDFNDYEIVRNSDTVMLDRLKTFIRDNNLEMPDLEEIKEHYKIIE